jgi:hypothetical protein
MRHGISALVRHNISIRLWLWRGGHQHSIVLSTLRAALLLFAARALVPADQVKKTLFGTPYELQPSAVFTTD